MALNDGWRFKLDPPEGFWAADFDDADWSKIKVPAHWEMEGFHNDTGIGGYRLHFTAPKAAERVKLDFEGVYSGAEVWVNGQFVATHEGGAMPFEADITDVVKPGDNVLALRVREHTVVSDKLDHMSLYADFPLAGIMRPVYLFTTPRVHLVDLKIVTTFDKDYRNATMHMRGRVLNESPQPFRGRVSSTLAGPLVDVHKTAALAIVSKGKSRSIELGSWQSAEVQIDLSVAAPKKWNAEQPNLYALAARVLTEQGVGDQFAMAVGFRQTEIRGTEILINGRPVKFRGTCRHDSHPLLGRAVTAEIARRDLLLMKEANLNAVRTSHYPPVRELAEVRRRVGRLRRGRGLVLLGQRYQRSPQHAANPANGGRIAGPRPQPSLRRLLVGLQREPIRLRAATRARVDSRRPTPAARPAPPLRLGWRSPRWHNPMSVSRIHENEKIDKPLLFDESLGIFQGIWGDGPLLWIDPGMRDYYAEPLVAVYDSLHEEQGDAGLIHLVLGRRPVLRARPGDRVRAKRHPVLLRRGSYADSRPRHRRRRSLGSD